jgi:hypothetical protein
MTAGMIPLMPPPSMVRMVIYILPISWTGAEFVKMMTQFSPLEKGN